MENLEIISTTTTVQAKEEINGNTANYSWYNEQNELPKIVNFSIQRGLIGENEFTGNNIISGAYYADSGKFDVQNDNFKEGDLELYAQLIARCKELTTEIEN